MSVGRADLIAGPQREAVAEMFAASPGYVREVINTCRWPEAPRSLGNQEAVGDVVAAQRWQGSSYNLTKMVFSVRGAS